MNSGYVTLEHHLTCAKCGKGSLMSKKSTIKLNHEGKVNKMGTWTGYSQKLTKKGT